jgi:DNA (cytosine-5)-methyltransferase 1
MKYFSLFSGIGGFELGIQRASDNKCSPECQEPKQEEPQERRKWSIGEQGEGVLSRQNAPLCVGYSEINKYATKIYQQHFPEHRNYGDATKINAADLPDFDMLCGGFPCQSFSIAGKRKGFEDTRGTLFHEILRIASEKRPGTIFLENVKGLLSADRGRCFGVIICSLDELGYVVEWQVLNSKNFGVPQNRERVFIIGHLRGEPFREVFPLRKSIEVLEREHGEIKMIQNSGKEIARVYGSDGLSPTLKGKTGGWQEPKVFQVHRKNELREHTDTVACLQATGRGIGSKMMVNLHQWRTGEYGDGIKENESFTLDQGSGRDYCIINGAVRSGGRGSLERHQWDIVEQRNSIRRLTPVECERLQGFPDNWTCGISDSQRYKCLGNAVTVNVIEEIVMQLCFS